MKCSVEDKLKAVLDIRRVVELVERGAIPRTVGEGQRVVEMNGQCWKPRSERPGHIRLFH